MKTVIIDRAFEGYPDADDKPGVQFAVSEKPIEAPGNFADMIVGKGLAHFPPATGAAPSNGGEALPVADESHSDKPEGEA